MPVNIFQLAIDRLQEQQQKKVTSSENDTAPTSGTDANRSENSYVVIFGSKSCGKSSLILRFLERDEATKPTIALDYSYGRRPRGNAKDVGHLWELGGGIFLLDLLEIPLQNTMEDTSFVIMVDLSKPEEMWTTLQRCLEAGRQTIENIARGQGSDFKAQLQARSWERVGSQHQDAALINPFPIPLTIIGGKYDEFQTMDPESRKMISKTLRFMAHSNGASLECFSSKVEGLVNRGRAVLSQYLFGTSASKSTAVDYTKPLHVPVGLDSFEDIGAPPVENGNDQLLHATSPTEMWQAAFTTMFPQVDLKAEISEDPSSDPQFKEESIDLLRERKYQELEKYLNERARIRQLEEEGNA